MAATTLKGTNAYCTIKNITVTREKAYVTFLLYSNTYQKDPQIPFKFKMTDYYYDGTTQESYINQTVYWIDNFYYGETLVAENQHVSINLNKEITFVIDITNKNKSKIKELSWVRDIRFLIVDANKPSEVLWKSDRLNLISSKINLPTIKNFIVRSYDQDTIDPTVDTIKTTLFYTYETEADFNYTNTNIEYVFQLLNNAEDIVLQEVILKENDSLDLQESIGVIEYNFKGEFNNFIKARVIIRLLNGEIVYQETKLYKPIALRNPIYIKHDGEVKRVHSVFTNKTGD